MNLVCLTSQNTFLPLSASMSLYVKLMEKKYIPRDRLLTLTHKISTLIAFKCKNKPLCGANDKILLF